MIGAIDRGAQSPFLYSARVTFCIGADLNTFATYSDISTETQFCSLP